jgi:hypothetical protein
MTAPSPLLNNPILSTTLASVGVPLTGRPFRFVFYVCIWICKSTIRLWHFVMIYLSMFVWICHAHDHPYAYMHTVNGLLWSWPGPFLSLAWPRSFARQSITWRMRTKGMNLGYVRILTRWVCLVRWKVPKTHKIYVRAGIYSEFDCGVCVMQARALPLAPGVLLVRARLAFRIRPGWLVFRVLVYMHECHFTVTHTHSRGRAQRLCVVHAGKSPSLTNAVYIYIYVHTYIYIHIRTYIRKRKNPAYTFPTYVHISTLNIYFYAYKIMSSLSRNVMSLPFWCRRWRGRDTQNLKCAPRSHIWRIGTCMHTTTHAYIYH